MKNILKTLFCLLILILFTSTSFADVYVKGYYKKNGTYVAPHYRSNRDNTVKNNFSYDGNINPYTGKEGNNKYKNDPSSEYYEYPTAEKIQFKSSSKIQTIYNKKDKTSNNPFENNNMQKSNTFFNSNEEENSDEK